MEKLLKEKLEDVLNDNITSRKSFNKLKKIIYCYSGPDLMLSQDSKDYYLLFNFFRANYITIQRLLTTSEGKEYAISLILASILYKSLWCQDSLVQERWKHLEYATKAKEIITNIWNDNKVARIVYDLFRYSRIFIDSCEPKLQLDKFNYYGNLKSAKRIKRLVSSKGKLFYRAWKIFTSLSIPVSYHQSNNSYDLLYNRLPEFDNKSYPVSGSEIMSELGLSEGPNIGYLKEMIKNTNNSSWKDWCLKEYNIPMYATQDKLYLKNPKEGFDPFNYGIQNITRQKDIIINGLKYPKECDKLKRDYDCRKLILTDTSNISLKDIENLPGFSSIDLKESNGDLYVLVEYEDGSWTEIV